MVNSWHQVPKLFHKAGSQIVAFSVKEIYSLFFLHRQLFSTNILNSFLFKIQNPPSPLYCKSNMQFLTNTSSAKMAQPRGTQELLQKTKSNCFAVERGRSLGHREYTTGTGKSSTATYCYIVWLRYGMCIAVGNRDHPASFPLPRYNKRKEDGKYMLLQSKAT